VPMDSSASKTSLAASFAAASAAWYSGSSTIPACYGVGLTNLSSLVERPCVITSYRPFRHRVVERYTEPAASRARCRSRVQIPPLSAPPAAAASKFIAVPLNGAWRGELEAKPVHDESLVTIQGRALYRRNAELQELEVDNAALVEEDQGTDLPTA